MFESPAFSLWKNKAILIENVFNLFSPFGIEITDISTENENGSLGDESIVVNLEDLGEFKLRYSNINWESEDNSKKDLSEIFEIIAYINDKLPSITAGLKYDYHLLEFGGHGGLETGFSFQSFLQQFHEPKLKSIHQNLPNGMMFNWQNADAQSRFHVEIDESLNIPGGIFMRWVVRFSRDKIELSDFQEAFFVTLGNVLDELGLQFED
jgi:hypothetical protein